MCGLIGAFRAANAPFPAKIREFVPQGLYISALRGFGGTGVGIVGHDYLADLSKDHVDAANFIFTDKFDWVAKHLHDSRAVLGHTRAPTGNAPVSTKNAHPFYFGTVGKNNAVIGIHNGHINNHYALSPNTFNHQVDSAHAIYSIWVNGAKETLEKIDGYYVLVWYNEKDRTMNIARNNHRDLYLAQSKDGRQMYYASEKIILEFALTRAGIDWDEDMGFMEIPPHKLYTWKLDENDKLEAIVTSYKERKLPQVSQYPAITMGGEKLLHFGDIVYCKIPDPETAFVPYQPDGHWGYAVGLRTLDNAIVKVSGMDKADWESKWKHIADSLCIRVESARMEEDTQGVRRPFYSGSVNKEEAERDYKRFLEKGKHKYGEIDPKKAVSPKKSADDSSSSKTAGTGKEEVVDFVAGPKNILIPEPEWTRMAKEGCCVCRGSITPKDVGKVLFYAWQRNPEDSRKDTEYAMVCPVCREDTESVEAALGYMPTGE